MLRYILKIMSILSIISIVGAGIYWEKLIKLGKTLDLK